MSRLTVWSLSFALAAVIFCYVMPEGALLPTLIFLTAAFVSAFLLKGDGRFYTAMVSSALLLGLLWSFGYAKLCDMRVKPYAGSVQEVNVVCTDFGEKTDYGEKVSVKLGSGFKRVRAILYFFNESPELSPGDGIKLEAKLVLPDSVFEDGADSFAAEQIDLFIYPTGQYEVTKSPFRLKYLHRYAAKRVFDTADIIFGGDTAGFMTALLTGNKSELKKDVFLTEAMSKVGVSHVVAVSGMHVSFVVQFLAMLTPSKKKRAYIGIPLIVFFAAMTGFTPSVVRAGIMQIVVLLGVILKRSADSMTSLSLALLILLLQNPGSVMNIGLQLSFAATAGMIIVSGRIYEPIYAKYKKKGLLKKHIRLRRLFSVILGTFCSNIGAISFTVPLIAVHFGTVSLASFAVNILIFWAVSASFTLGYAAVLLGIIIPPAGAFAAAVVSVFPRLIIFVISLFSGFGFSSLYTSNPYVIIWLVYVYVLFISVLAAGAKLRNMLLPSLLAVSSLCVILFWSSVTSRPSEGLRASVLNVGQGLCCVVRSGDSTAVIDCGSSSGEDAGEIAVRSIYGSGGDHIDILILTHYHSDHVNGVTKLLALCSVGTVLMPEPAADDMAVAGMIEGAAKRSGTEITYISEVTRVSFGASGLLLVPPNGVEENERCISVLCSCGKYDILVTGDAGKITEMHLLDENYLPDLEVLVVGHHGSKSSTSRELLAGTSPETAIISVGENTYGHPADETVERLEAYGARVFRTDRDGTVTVTSN